MIHRVGSQLRYHYVEHWIEIMSQRKLDKARWAIQLLNFFSRAAKSDKFALLSRAIKHSDIQLEVLSLQNSKSFEHFFCFRRTLGISPRFRRIQTDIAFIYTVLACSLAISTNLNFDFDFCNAKFH